MGLEGVGLVGVVAVFFFKKLNMRVFCDKQNREKPTWPQKCKLTKKKQAKIFNKNNNHLNIYEKQMANFPWFAFDLPSSSYKRVNTKNNKTSKHDNNNIGH